MIFNLCLLFCLYNIQYTQKPYKITWCSILGLTTSLLYFVGQGYFAALCLDLRQTLLNPFREPMSKSFAIHYYVWLICLPIVLIALACGGFQYRIDYDICFICYTGDIFNVYKIFLVYIPLIGSNLIGIITLINARVRLKQGLPSTLKSRRMIVRRQSILVLWFNSALFCILVLILIPMQYTANSNNDYEKLSNNCIMYDKTYDNRKALSQFPISFFGLLFLNPLADAGAFICLSLIDLSKQRQKEKLKKLKKRRNKYKKNRRSRKSMFQLLLSSNNNSLNDNEININTPDSDDDDHGYDLHHDEHDGDGRHVSFNVVVNDENDKNDKNGSNSSLSKRIIAGYGGDSNSNSNTTSTNISREASASDLQESLLSRSISLTQTDYDSDEFLDPVCVNNN